MRSPGVRQDWVVELRLARLVSIVFTIVFSMKIIYSRITTGIIYFTRTNSFESNWLSSARSWKLLIWEWINIICIVKDTHKYKKEKCKYKERYCREHPFWLWFCRICWKWKFGKQFFKNLSSFLTRDESPCANIWKRILIFD